MRAMGSRLLTGSVVKNRPDPPSFTATPWNQLTIALRYSTALPDVENRSILNAGSIQTSIYSQLGFPSPIPTDTPDIEFRMKELRAWCTTGYSATDASNISAYGYSTVNMDVYDLVNPTLTDNNKRILQSTSDVSSKLLDANVGYIYPVTQRNTVNELSVINNTIAGFDWRGNCLTVYAYVLWRFQPPQNSVDYFSSPTLIAKHLEPSKNFTYQSTYQPTELHVDATWDPVETPGESSQDSLGVPLETLA